MPFIKTRVFVSNNVPLPPGVAIEQKRPVDRPIQQMKYRTWRIDGVKHRERVGNGLI